jgi:hypothetical protein
MQRKQLIFSYKNRSGVDILLITAVKIGSPDLYRIGYVSADRTASGLPGEDRLLHRADYNLFRGRKTEAFAAEVIYRSARGPAAELFPRFSGEQRVPVGNLSAEQRGDRLNIFGRNRLSGVKVAAAAGRAGDQEGQQHKEGRKGAPRPADSVAFFHLRNLSNSSRLIPEYS